MSEPPRTERERDLVREIVELVGGSSHRREADSRTPQRPARPAIEPAAPLAPSDQEEAP